MARPSLLALRLFEVVFLPWMRRRVRVRLAGLPDGLSPDMPLLIVANHVSWWDGFVLREIHRRLRPAAPLRVVMTEAELRRHPVLGWIAAIPMRPGSASSVLATFRRLRRLREVRSDAVVLFFPQGRIWPSQRRPLGFERGVSTLARTLAPVQVLPVGLHMEPLAAVQPVIFASAGPLRRIGVGVRPDPRIVEASVQAQLDAIAAFVAEHGERAERAWPDAFEPLPAAPLDDPPAGVRTLRPRLRVVPDARASERKGKSRG